MKRVAIYSGTFDPIHDGHVWFIDYVLNDLRYDEVMILVEPDPRRKTPQASFYDRLQMVKLCFKDESRVSINPLAESEDTYSIEQTFDDIKSFYKSNTSLSLMMGGDVFEYVPAWKGIQSILDEVAFIVALRTEDDGEVAAGLMTNELAGVSTHLVQSGEHGISSTAIRKTIALTGEATTVNGRVAAYIEDHGLYR